MGIRSVSIFKTDMNIGPFKTDVTGDRIALAEPNKKGKTRLNREEVLQLLDTICNLHQGCKATVVGSRRFTQNEMVTFTVSQENGIILRGVDAYDSCKCIFNPDTEKDAIVNLAKNSIAVTDSTGAALTLFALDHHSLPIDLETILPEKINNGVRGESLLFTGPLARIRMDITKGAAIKMSSAVLKESNYITHLVTSAITEAGPLCKYPFNALSIELDRNYDKDANTCEINGFVVIAPSDESINPHAYQEFMENSIRQRLDTIKDTKCDISVMLCPTCATDLRYRVHVKKGIRTFNADTIIKNGQLVSQKVHELLTTAFPEPELRSNLAHYTVPVKCSEGNAVYAILVGLGLTKLTAVMDALNKTGNTVDSPKSTVLQGTESWMIRINFKDQTP